jgi:hypothetical protein
VTLTEKSATTHENGMSPASASAVTNRPASPRTGTADSTTITATEVIPHPPASVSSTASEVIPFSTRTADPTKTIGQIPADYTQGQGTIATPDGGG